MAAQADESARNGQETVTKPTPLELDSVDLKELVASLSPETLQVALERALETTLREAANPRSPRWFAHSNSTGLSSSPLVSRDHLQDQSPRTITGTVGNMNTLAAELTPEQLDNAKEVFELFDKDGKGRIGHHELNYALAKLGQRASTEEVSQILGEFDYDQDGFLDFQEFLSMMKILGWEDIVTLPQQELKKLRVSNYGQASICRWLDDAGPDGSGDVLGSDVKALTAMCRRIVMDKKVETMIYMSIVAASVISGMQSYKPNSEYENAQWAVVADVVILIVFSTEIAFKVLAEDIKHPHHFFWDPWNVFDLVVCALLIVTTLVKTLDTAVAPFRLIRLLRAIRLLRTVRLFPNLAIVVETTVKSASSVVYIGMFGLLFTYMFAIVGVAAFGVNDPFYFGNLSRAMLTLFRVLSMDSWSMIMYYNLWGCGQSNFDGMGNSRGYGDYFAENGMVCEFQPSGVFAAFYFVLFMCTVAFLILNLFIGIITTEMQDAKAEVERQRKVTNKLAMAVTLRMRTRASPRAPLEDVNPIAEAFDVEEGGGGGGASRKKGSKKQRSSDNKQQSQPASSINFDDEPDARTK